MNNELKMLWVLLHPLVRGGIVPVCRSGEWRAHMALDRNNAEQEAAILTFLAISMGAELVVCLSVVI